MFTIIPVQGSKHEHKKQKLTCLTCKFKKCVGRCQWEAADCPKPPRKAA